MANELEHQQARRAANMAARERQIEAITQLPDEAAQTRRPCAEERICAWCGEASDPESEGGELGTLRWREDTADWQHQTEDGTWCEPERM